MQANIAADRSGAILDLLQDAGSPIILAGKEVLALVGTHSIDGADYEEGYGEDERLSATVSADDAADVRPGDTAEVNAIRYTVTAIERDGATATLALT